jgi:D-glycero-D-manno-heptose 1,7-bisphosphate phosphatase
MGNSGKILTNCRFLFTDRDGVVNRHLKNDYVKSTGEFEFLPGVLPALASLSAWFELIIVITNQRGIGKGLFSENDLADIHRYMISTIEANNGRIDAIYHCTALDDANPYRKPNSGMAFTAKNDFPKIDFSLSVMLGDSKSDIDFGNRLGMTTVLIGTDAPRKQYGQDFSFYSLANFASFLEKM